MAYSVLIVSDVLLAIFSAASALQAVNEGNLGWALFWAIIAGASSFFAYWLLKD